MSEWVRKFSSAIYAKGLMGEVVPPLVQNTVSTDIERLDVSLGSWSSLELDEVADPPPPPPPPPQRVMTHALLKKNIQSGVQERVNGFWQERIGQYVMQGDYTALLIKEGSCITWGSYLWNIPQGVLKFAMNAGFNTLPTFDNLKRWKKRVNDRCPFCGNIQTLLHVLSNCSVSLDQGRYTWRHNSVLNSLIAMIRPALGPTFELFSDLPGFEAPHGGTIPPNILVTNLRPDLFIVSESLCRARSLS